jgi:hypothetical protein
VITTEDLEFHRRSAADAIWTETTYLAFHVPEAALLGTLYVLARPNLGVALSSVVIARGFRTHAHEVDFCDPQIHLPCPESYSDFTLRNGLSVSAKSLTAWDFSYQHNLGYCDFSLHFEAAHHPYDPLDPAQNPLAKPKSTESDQLIGDAWSNGHFDIKGRITGSLTLYGTRYEIDCFDGMDRSWGPRNETPQRATAYVSANFGERLAIWLTMTLDVKDTSRIVYDRVNSGFVVSDGEVTPVVEASVRADSEDMLARRDQITVVDARGRRFELSGTAIGTRPLGSFNPSIAAFQSLMRYECGDLVGYGGHGKLFGLAYLNRMLASRGDEPDNAR